VPWWSDWPFGASDAVLPRDPDQDKITEYHMRKNSNACPGVEKLRNI